ncbi:hypothetical protein [Salinispora oceanensis]|uniref:hypothetical protein n=1 Tax=Salinispora oceanensis TaxID=1050199 RepID=UPI000368AC87|nr:hypothetical protein [Salinispora oceanensis]
MRRLRLLLGWPGPSWVFPAAGVLMAAASLLATNSLLAADYVTWAAVSAAWHESLWIPGSVAAAAAAALGAAYFPRSSPLAAPLRPRMGDGLFLMHGLALAFWLCLGHATGLVPAHIAAARQATSGALAPSDVIVGLAGLAALTLIGFCLGVALRHWVVAPAVGVLTFAVMGLPNAPLRVKGGPFDVRMCVEGADPRHVLSTSAIVEDLDFSVGASAEGRETGVLVMRQPGRVDGLLLWIRLWGHREDEPVDAQSR